MRAANAAARAPSPVDWAEQLGDKSAQNPNLSSIYLSEADFYSKKNI